MAQTSQSRETLKNLSIPIGGSGCWLFGIVVGSLLSSLGIRATKRYSALSQALVYFMAAVRMGDDILDAVGESLPDTFLDGVSGEAAQNCDFVRLSRSALVNCGVRDLALAALPVRHLKLGDRSPLDVLDSLVEEMKRTILIAEKDFRANLEVYFRRAYNDSFASYMLERRVQRHASVEQFDLLAYAKSARIVASLVELGESLNEKPDKHISNVKEFFEAFALMLTQWDDLFDFLKDRDVQPNFFWVYSREREPMEHVRIRTLSTKRNRNFGLFTLFGIWKAAPNTFSMWWNTLRLHRQNAKLNSPFIFVFVELPFILKFLKRLIFPY